jgi:LemA protein
MKKSMVGLGCLGIVLIGALIVGIALWSGYNGLVQRSQAVDKAWADVQSVYQRRADLIPNLVNTVAGAANFEKGTLTEVTRARASVGQVQVNANQAPADQVQLERYQQAQEQLSSALSRLLVVVERYPELKANQNFRDLQAQLEGTENRISVERRRYNEAVQAYNTAIKRFPTVLFAGLFGFDARPYFTAREGSDVAPPVRFDFGTPAPAQQP